MKVQNVIKIEPEDFKKIRVIAMSCFKADFDFCKIEEALMAEIQDLVTEAYRLGLEQGAKAVEIERREGGQ